MPSYFLGLYHTGQSPRRRTANRWAGNGRWAATAARARADTRVSDRALHVSWCERGFRRFNPSQAGPPQELPQRGVQLLIAGQPRRRLRIDDHIVAICHLRQFRARQYTESTPYQIALVRSRGHTFAHHEREAGHRPCAGRPLQPEQWMRQPPSTLPNPAEIVPPAQAMLSVHLYTTVSRVRPFKRRALRMRWPERLDIRFRKPCSRRRGIRFGCHVRFIFLYSSVWSAHTTAY